MLLYSKFKISWIYNSLAFVWFSLAYLAKLDWSINDGAKIWSSEILPSPLPSGDEQFPGGSEPEIEIHTWLMNHFSA